tara:strand:- start:2648 stop:3178 length:531 start_codon:yes stop_codon:yes gene_type:complete
LIKKKFLIFIFLILSSSNLFIASANIVYLDINTILNKSEVGMSVNNQIKSIQKKNSLKKEKIEKKLLIDQKSLAAKKNILDQAEYKKKIIIFKNEVTTHKQKQNKFFQELSNKKLAATQNMLNQINVILAKYSEEKKLQLIIQKKNIIIGKKELDITDDILKIVNQNMKKIKIKYD